MNQVKRLSCAGSYVKGVCPREVTLADMLASFLANENS